MAKSFMNEPSILGKITLLISGQIIFIVGYVSYFLSSWSKKGDIDAGFYVKNVEIYKVCSILEWPFKLSRQKCPDIAMERYFLAAITICLLFSVAALVAEFYLDMREGVPKFVDLGYHIVAAILLLVAGIVYIVSAVQIDRVWNLDLLYISNVNFRMTEKIIAAGLTIVQCFLYCGVAYFIARRQSGPSPRTARAKTSPPRI